MQYAYRTYDVFTGERFGGNPLAIVMDAEGLSTAEMQRLAAEFNYSETTFVLPGTSPRQPRVRIFTPKAEMPFAGHPTVGTALCLKDLGRVDGDAVTLELAAGPVPVTFDSQGMAEFRAPRPFVREAAFAGQAAAAALGLAPAQIVGDGCRAGVGYAFPLVELADLEALAAARMLPVADDHPLASEVFLFVRVAANALRARMFAPRHGIPEDPATGSAAAALMGHLADSHPAADIELAVDLAQGVEMGRPSRILLRAVKHRGKVEAVYVKGQAVPVAEGRIHAR